MSVRRRPETNPKLSRKEKRKMSTTRRRRAVLLLAGLASIIFGAFSAAPALAAFGVQPDSFSVVATGSGGGQNSQAGGHANLLTSFKFNERQNEYGDVVPDGDIKDTVIDLPPGLIGDTTSIPQCSIEEFLADEIFTKCDASSQIGIGRIDVKFLPSGPRFVSPSKIYNLVPAHGQVARFGLLVGRNVTIVTAKLRTGSDYGVTASVRSVPGGLMIFGGQIEFWGVPADPSHDADRGGPASSLPAAFLSSPTSCGSSAVSKLTATPWQHPDRPDVATYEIGPNLGCDGLLFEPSFLAEPTTRQAGAASGLVATLEVPQVDSPYGSSASHLKDAEIKFPTGMTINPASADGQVGCSVAEIDLHGADAASCPDASKIGTVEIETPVLDHPLRGAIYLATQGSNPFNSLLATYITVDDAETGVVIKLAGKVSPDPETGQLTATFGDNPQLPFEKMSLSLKGGPRAPFTTPSACGTYTTAAELTPWARPSEPVTSISSFTIDQNCGKDSQFAPGFEAGTTNPVGGQSSPFVLRVTRQDAEQNISRIETTLPEGVLAKLAGVAICPEAHAPTGDCPVATQVGTATVGVGSGSSPLYVPEPGRTPTAVYLAGPYKGAPYSLIAKVPAQAGPFDLGTVTVRNSIEVDPVTAQVTVKSDPLPQILQGIPISYRDIRVVVNRDDFTVNPTSCDPMIVSGAISSAQGRSASVSTRFQANSCQRLAFKPKLTMRMYGAPPRRGGFPALKAVLTAPKGQANIGKATVTMPKTELLEQGHIRTLCTRDQWAAETCPKGSIYGKAKAFTPLLDKPLEGNVYLRSNGGARELPDLVADLKGQIDIELVGYIDAVNARLRARFLNVPDAPVSKFVLQMQGGQKGLLAHNTNVCRNTPRASVKFDGQNGKVHDFNPKVVVGGCGKKGK